MSFITAARVGTGMGYSLGGAKKAEQLLEGQHKGHQNADTICKEWENFCERLF